MNSPFESQESFKVNIKSTHEDWLDGILNFNQIKQFALYRSTANFKDGNIKDFKYEFSPYDNMSVESRRIEKDVIPLELFSDSKRKDPAKFFQGKPKKFMEQQGINDFSIELYVFDKSSDVTRFIVKDKKSFKDYLTENGGIRIFRDNMRVLDYGEKGNDWLNLDSKRVNNPASSLSNNIILGAISLKRKNSRGLVEKANREGFIDNQSYEVFVEISIRIDYANP